MAKNKNSFFNHTILNTSPIHPPLALPTVLTVAEVRARCAMGQAERRDSEDLGYGLARGCAIGVDVSGLVAIFVIGKYCAS